MIYFLKHFRDKLLDLFTEQKREKEARPGHNKNASHLLAM